MPEEEKERRGRPGQLPLELRVADSQVRAASFTSLPGGGGDGLFSCSVGALADDEVSALERAAHEHTRVRLVFGESPVLLDLVTLERKEPHAVRIVGHIVDLRTVADRRS